MSLDYSDLFGNIFQQASITNIYINITQRRKQLRHQDQDQERAYQGHINSGPSG